MGRRNVLGISSCPREVAQAPSLSYALQGPLCPHGYWECEREWEEGHKPNWGALRGQEKCLLLLCRLSPRESPKALGLGLHPPGPSLPFEVPSTLQDLLCLCRSYRCERKGVGGRAKPWGKSHLGFRGSGYLPGILPTRPQGASWGPRCDTPHPKVGATAEAPSARLNPSPKPQPGPCPAEWVLNQDPAPA